jgi:zinc transport system ATP-binding protein
VADPDLLIFDEPTANIDPQGKHCLYQLLAELGEDITIVVVSHDLIVATASIDRIAVVNKRLIVSDSNELTPDMLQLIYGVHHHACPVDSFMHGLTTMLSPSQEKLMPQAQAPQEADQE